MFRIICIAIGYLFGCFQTAYLITRHKISQDIRDFGTGNMGTANVTQTLGPKAGLIRSWLMCLKRLSPATSAA